ncbi:ComEA family DNA-binding protein [Dyadobacter subterraneus]|uniref:Helix-hairpin-helix domain-containing protein n=1 Tax=Dyadobacter subterraneus TaxID=2773304 RepID=A0ABR9WKI2_9BACT|nr:helix-hairpin-helix domain-containing protein [Dyadobacter subterraneus]MBE9466020.1 helix-hairpin-helix domain-containing protein [Dyadobacter subterraneus]
MTKNKEKSHMKPAYQHSCAIFRLGVLTLFCIFIFVKNLFAQEPPRPEIDINQFIQDLSPIATEENSNEGLYELLFQLYTNPLDLNTVTTDELTATLILSETQIKSFFDYREKLGPFLSLYELQAIPDFDIITIRKLIPFVIVRPKALPFKESLRNPSQHFLLLRSGRVLETQKGFTSIDTSSRSTTRYQGKPLYGNIRYRYARAGSYSFGFVMENDAGEVLSWQPKKQIFGADFTSFHAQIMNRGKLKNLIIGDYQMQAGQGLVMSGGFSLGKGSEVIRTTYRSTLGLRPFTSVLESGFFRGAAATYSVKKQMDVTLFYSYTRRDGNLESNAVVQDELTVSTLQISGYHRTKTERENQGTIGEQNVGFHALYKLFSQRGQIGITVLNTFYSATLHKKDELYNKFEFQGNQNTVIGIHGDYRWQNMHFFGEGARSKSGGWGGVGGLIAGLGRTIDFTLLLRHYDRNFHSLYGGSISEATRPINETGTYWGLRYSPNRRWQFSGFYDRFHFPWLKYQINAPSDGQDYFLHALWKPNKKLNMYAVFHEKHKAHNEPGSKFPIPQVLETTRRTAMINFEYEVPLRFSVRTRLQGGDFWYEGKSKSSGFTIVQDITYRLSKLELSGRIAFFKTDDYDSRQYVYEKDMLYAFSLPAYYDQGIRHYLMLRYPLTQKMRLWLRWSRTHYSKLDEISSGLNEIQGKKRSELKAQVMYQF